VLDFEFRAAMKLLFNESVVLHLPDFALPLGAVEVYWRDPRVFGLGEWSQEAHELTVYMLADILPNTLTQLRLQAFTGVTMPFLGVRNNFAGLKVSTPCADGPVPPTSAMQVQPVGAFGLTPRLKYGVEGTGVGRINETVSILVSFSAKMGLLPGERITIRLPGFQVPKLIKPT
jgi:hypothetical protein